MSRRRLLAPLLVACALASVTAARTPDPAAPSPYAALLPPDMAQRLDARYWIARWPDAGAVRLDTAAVARQNARTRREDPALVDLAALPGALAAQDIRARVLRLSIPPASPRVHVDGRAVDAADRQRWTAALDLGALDDDEPRAIAWALATRRAALRTFPTDEPVFSAADERSRDLDRFQESALFPGTPVAVLHASADGEWRFVQAETYAAWVRADALAIGPRDTVLGYAAKASRVIVAAEARLATTPEAPALSGLVLDMGVALPERTGVDPATPVHGQAAMGQTVVEVPQRDEAGRLRLVPALLPRGEASHDGPLPASRANLLRQAFRFLGERYGWGHGMEGRDCSGFVAEVYRSVGLVLPRNTRDQAASPAFRRTVVPAGWTRQQRLDALRALQPGDLAYLLGHVVMVVGHDAQGPWVIHDVHQGRVPDGRGGLATFPINGVAVTPLLPLHDAGGRAYVDALTVLLQVLPPDGATDP